MILDAVLGALVTLLVVWLVLVAFLALHRSHAVGARDAVRLVPDTIRLFRGLIADPTVKRGVRFRLGLVLAYLVFPIDVIPDFVPVIGYADDVIVVAIGLRLALRHAGAERVRASWPGTPEGLAALGRLCSLPELTKPDGNAGNDGLAE